MESIYVISAIIILAILVITSIYNSPNAKGKRGEKAVARRLSRLPKKKYCVFNDLMIIGRNGTVQIDHIIVSKYGIFVIETKNFKGWICGGENSYNWTQNIYGEKHTLRNPIQQNEGHISAIKKYLDIPDYAYISIIAFSRKADIKVKTESNVVHINKVKKAILRYKEEILTVQQVEYAIRTLQGKTITNKKIRGAHKKRVRNSIKAYRRKTKRGICPKCGGKLIVRSSKYGKFLGCINYPECRYTDKRR